MTTSDALEPSALLPCPFCAGAPHPRTGSTFTKPNYSVFCRVCFSGTGVFATEFEARAAWNRRAAATPKAAVVEISMKEATVIYNTLRHPLGITLLGQSGRRELQTKLGHLRL